MNFISNILSWVIFIPMLPILVVFKLICMAMLKVAERGEDWMTK